MVNRRILALVLFSGMLLGLVLTGEAQQESLEQRQTLRRHLLEASATSNGNGQVASASNNAGGNGDGNGPPPNNGEGNIKNGEPGHPMRAVHFTIDADSEFKKNTKDVAPSGQACFGGCSRCKSEPSCPIDYNNYNSATNTGPPVMNGAVTIYYIFYGFWNDPSTALKEQILVNLATGIGRSAYLSINNKYFSVTSGVKKPLTVGSGNNNPTYGKQYYDLYQSFPKGTTLSQTNLATIVTNALSSGGLPTDSNAVYFVLTSSDVAVGDSNGHFCSNYCGYHSTLSYTNLPIKWATVGDASVQCPGGCISSVVQSNPPNGDAGADGMASVISHELEETLTDPQLNAWYDAKGEENADKCAWTFGTVKGNYNVDLSAIVPAPSGTRYTGRYLIQQNFNPNTKACVLS